MVCRGGLGDTGDVYRAALLLVVMACGRVAFDPLDQGGGPDGGSTHDGTPHDGASLDGRPPDGPPAACACADAMITVNHTSATGHGFTALADRGLAGSCGGSGAAEAILEIRAQVAGTYTVRMAQAGPTTLYVRDGCCAGPELDCTTSPMTVRVFQLAAGQSIVAIADGMSIGQTALFDVTGDP